MDPITRKCCRQLLRNSMPRWVCNPAQSNHAFSTTSRYRRGALPVFLEPSSVELRDLLSTINARILMPQHLTKEQKELVYKPVNRAKLEAEPVEITLGDVTLPLEHMDRNHMPNRWHTLRAVLDQSKTVEDWENVIRVLEGMHTAGLKITPAQQEKVVRSLHGNKMHHLVLKALQRTSATNLSLRNYDVLLQVLRGFHDKAALSDWSADETTSAFRFAKQVVELMDHKQHCDVQSRRESTQRVDWRSWPAVIALPTELAAILALRHGGPTDTVRILANRLMHTISKESYVLYVEDLEQKITQTIPDTKMDYVRAKAGFKLTNSLFDSIIVWTALRTSRAVLGNDMPMPGIAAQLEVRFEEVVASGVNTLANQLPYKEESPYVAHARALVERSRSVTAV